MKKVKVFTNELKTYELNVNTIAELKEYLERELYNGTQIVLSNKSGQLPLDAKVNEDTVYFVTIMNPKLG